MARPGGRNRAACGGGEKKTQTHREDLMNADTLSEILLLVCSSVIFVALLLILLAALTQTAALTSPAMHGKCNEASTAVPYFCTGHCSS